jgi:hypothetical protein
MANPTSTLDLIQDLLTPRPEPTFSSPSLVKPIHQSSMVGYKYDKPGELCEPAHQKPGE